MPKSISSSMSPSQMNWRRVWQARAKWFVLLRIAPDRSFSSYLSPRPQVDAVRRGCSLGRASLSDRITGNNRNSAAHQQSWWLKRTSARHFGARAAETESSPLLIDSMRIARCAVVPVSLKLNYSCLCFPHSAVHSFFLSFFFFLSSLAGSQMSRSSARTSAIPGSAYKRSKQTKTKERPPLWQTTQRRR